MSELTMHYSLLDADDSDLERIAGMWPALDLFVDSRILELVWSENVTEFLFPYNITPDRIRWYLPTGVSAHALRRALRTDAKLYCALLQAHSAMSARVEVSPACDTVKADLYSLGDDAH